MDIIDLLSTSFFIDDATPSDVSVNVAENVTPISTSFMLQPRTSSPDPVDISSVDATSTLSIPFLLLTPSGPASSRNASTVPYWTLPQRVALSTALSVIMVAAIVGNLLVIVVVLRNRCMRTRTNLFLCSLAVSDLLCAVIDMPFSLLTVAKGRWMFDDHGGICDLNGFAMVFLFVASIHTLMYIAIHKYLSIANPFRRSLGVRAISLMIAAAWLWALAAGAVTASPLVRVVYKPYAAQCGPDYPSDVRSLTHFGVVVTTCYVVPLIVIAVCYALMFRTILDHGARLRSTTTEQPEWIYRQQRHITVTLLMVVVAFLLTWTPWVVYAFYVVFNKDIQNTERPPPLINPLVYWCGYLNSACNPIIYALRSEAFREGYVQIFCAAKLKKKVHGNGCNNRVAAAVIQTASTTQNDGCELHEPDGLVSATILNATTAVADDDLIGFTSTTVQATDAAAVDPGEGHGQRVDAAGTNEQHDDHVTNLSERLRRSFAALSFIDDEPDKRKRTDDSCQTAAAARLGVDLMPVSCGHLEVHELPRVGGQTLPLTPRTAVTLPRSLEPPTYSNNIRNSGCTNGLTKSTSEGVRLADSGVTPSAPVSDCHRRSRLEGHHLGGGLAGVLLGRLLFSSSKRRCSVDQSPPRRTTTEVESSTNREDSSTDSADDHAHSTEQCARRLKKSSRKQAAAAAAAAATANETTVGSSNSASALRRCRSTGPFRPVCRYPSIERLDCHADEPVRQRTATESSTSMRFRRPQMSVRAFGGRCAGRQVGLNPAGPAPDFVTRVNADAVAEASQAAADIAVVVDFCEEPKDIQRANESLQSTAVL